MLYGQVLIPSAVFEELTASRAGLPPVIDLASEPWLVVASAKNQPRVHELHSMDLVKLRQLCLQSSGADLLLVDQRRGRRTATAAGLTVTGLLGVVARAKRAGLIDWATGGR